MRPLELTRSGVAGTVVVFLVAAVCVRLGLWQLDRRSERLERNAVVAERMAAPPVILHAPPSDTVGLTHRRAAIEGPVDEDQTIVLAGRSHAGRPGVHIYSPVRLGAGAVLVNRGWLPAPDAATVELDSIRRPPGEPARYEGVLLPFPETTGSGESTAAFRRTWFRLDGEAIRSQPPYPVTALYLLATVGPEAAGPGGAAREPAAPDGGASMATRGSHPLRLAAPVLDPGPHLSYAVQWFSFAAVFLVGWAAVLLTRRGAASGPAGTTDHAGPYQS